MTAHDDHLAAAAREHAAVREERDELRATVRRLERKNGALLDDLHALQSTALRRGLEEQARMALAMARRFLDEGDPIESPRVVACVLKAMGLARDAEEVAA